MAIVYGDKKAGQFVKREAHDRTRKIWDIAIVTCLAAGAVFGFLVAVLLLSRSIWALRLASRCLVPLIVLEVLMAAAFFAARRTLDKRMDAIYRDRLKWLRGGQAEGLVAWHFQDLSNDWHVFHNVMRDGGWDIDHVLVGPAGIFAISTKSHRGLYSRENGKFLRNNQPTGDVAEADRMALRLKHCLRDLVGDVPWIQGVLAVPFAFIDFPPRQGNVWVLRCLHPSQVYSQHVNQRNCKRRTATDQVLCPAISARDRSHSDGTGIPGFRPQRLFEFHSTAEGHARRSDGVCHGADKDRLYVQTYQGNGGCGRSAAPL